MFKAGILAAAIAVVSASPLALRQTNETLPFPITLGQLGYPHGHSILAWTPTKTTIEDACTDISSRTAIQAINSGFPSNPLCDYPFTVNGQAGLTLLCADGTGEEAARVTAIATNGQETHKCTGLPLNIYPTTCGGGSSIWQLYACQ